MKKGTVSIIIAFFSLVLMAVIASNSQQIMTKFLGVEEENEAEDQGIIDLLGDNNVNAEEASQGKNGSAYDTSEEGTVHLRDKKLLYNGYDDEVVTMYLTVSSGAESEGTKHTWEEINTYSAYDYREWHVDRYKVEGLLQVGTEEGIAPGNLGYGVSVPNATVQIRGQTSSRYNQKNYKIELNRNVGTWRGQRTIALNKHMADGLRFRNKMCFDFVKDIDQLMGLRTTFVHLYVNDLTDELDNGFEDYGLYTQVELINKTALRTHGLDKNGHLYKVNFFEFYRYEDAIKLASDPSYDKYTFENYLEIKGNEDHAKLIKMLEDVEDLSLSTEEVISRHFDEENLTYFLAFNILTGNIDTQSRNCYLYSPLNSNIWYFLCWDMDASFEVTENEIRGVTDYGGWERGISNYWGNMLFQRCLKSDDFRKKLDDAILDIKGYLTGERVSEAVAGYRSIVENYVFAEPDIYYLGLTPEQYDKVAKALPSEVDLYYNNYLETLEYPQPFYIGVPEMTPEGISYKWDVSYDFQQDDILYRLKVARDYDMADVVDNYEGYWPSYTGMALEPGKYFAKIEAQDESGNVTPAFDYYVTDMSSKVYGVVAFYVGEDGKVDLYEAGNE
jgi:spore coat protein H